MLNLSSEEILAIRDFKSMETSSLLNLLGYSLDLSYDTQSVEIIKKGFLMYHELLSRRLSDFQRAYLDYFASNYWSYLLHLFSESSSDNLFRYSTRKQLFLLREALLFLSASRKENNNLKKRILTNLANTLSNTGRTVEAIDYWSEALKIDPNFGMALGNIGNGLCRYAYALYDIGHTKVMVSAAQKFLQKAVTGDLEHPRGKTFFVKIVQRNRRVFGEDLNYDTSIKKVYEMGNSNAENEYRKWCLRNVLFLNPLNDLGEYSIAANDVLGCPSVISPIDRGPEEMAFFNAIKQEFVSARWLYYSGISRNEEHFSDRETFLLNTLDYPVYGLKIQEIVLSIRSSFSVLDKIAFFINKYFELGITDKKVSFGRIWEQIDNKKNSDHENLLVASKNPYLSALRWVSMDLEKKDFNPTEPLAADICEIRNCSEHRYLKVHELFFEDALGYYNRVDQFADKWAFHISLDHLKRISLKALKLSRASIIYLSMSIESNERYFHIFLNLCTSS